MAYWTLVEMPILRPLPLHKCFGTRRFELVEDWQFFVYRVPKGFITDGASVPRILYWLFEPTGILFLPAIVHDWLYYKKEIPRAVADKIFRENVIQQGNIVAGWIAWLGVRMFGWISWHFGKDKQKGV